MYLLYPLNIEQPQFFCVKPVVFNFFPNILIRISCPHFAHLEVKEMTISADISGICLMELHAPLDLDRMVQCHIGTQRAGSKKTHYERSVSIC